MKTIYIVRHAKSSWDKLDLPDEQRPLMEKGKKRTVIIAAFLEEKKIKPDLIISSNAVRALETAKILANALNYPAGNIMVDSKIYHTDADGILNRFCGLPEQYESAMLVGHNPALTDFVNIFLKSPIENLPTSGMISFTFETDKWENLATSIRRTNFILFPKDMPGKDK